jgi:hypothetical protein
MQKLYADSQIGCLQYRNMCVQVLGQDHARVVWVNPIAGKANAKDAQNEPGPVPEFETAGKCVEHSTVVLREYGSV